MAENEEIELILEDAAERMDKSVEVLRHESGQHPHWPGEPVDA